jgi:4-amino-4-deoxy-L-arabinose transferase-like glycosyltransferase
MTALILAWARRNWRDIALVVGAIAIIAAMKWWYSAKLEAADRGGYARASLEWTLKWTFAELERVATINKVYADLAAQRRAAAQANAEAQRARDDARAAAAREVEVVIREVEAASPGARECVFDAPEAAAFNRVR